MSGDVKWIKLSTGIFQDETMRLIAALPEANNILIVWIMLLVLAGQKNAGGEISFKESLPYTDEMLALSFGRPVNIVRLALQTFVNFGMIEIQQDKTIRISKWSKHQNTDALDKIRLAATDRQRRHRLTQNNEACHVTERDTSRDCHVTEQNASRDSHVTVTSPSLKREIENKNKSKSTEEEREKKNEPLALRAAIPENGKGSGLSYEEAKVRLNILALKTFSRQLGEIWPNDLDHALNELVPIDPRDMRAIEWFYALPSNDPVFQNTARKQSFPALMRNFMEERDKALTARKAAGLDGLEPAAARVEPAGWREFYEKKYPNPSLPPSFFDLPPQERAQFERREE